MNVCGQAGTWNGQGIILAVATFNLSVSVHRRTGNERVQLRVDTERSVTVLAVHNFFFYTQKNEKGTFVVKFGHGTVRSQFLVSVTFFFFSIRRNTSNERVWLGIGMAQLGNNVGCPLLTYSLTYSLNSLLTYLITYILIYYLLALTL